MGMDFNDQKALQDFRSARSRATLQQVLARLTGSSVNLLPFDEISSKLRVAGGSDVGLKVIPLDAIVGSVSRSADYTRSFLPRKDSDIQRWAKVKQLMVSPGQSGLPPIEVYQIGEVYFVRDGHHRVSVARQIGAETIEAYVTEIRTRVPITPDISAEAIILRAEYADFLERTHVDELCPGVDLHMTFAGMYATLEEHINVHRYFMGIDFQREIPYEDAVKHWCEAVYTPVVEAIREQGALHEFRGRTETDLYLWISDHRALLQSTLGYEVPAQKAARQYIRERGQRFLRVLGRLRDRVLDRLLPDDLESQVEPLGSWRDGKEISSDHLLDEILVGFSGSDAGWLALEQAIVLAQREKSALRGLHLLPEDADSEADEVRDIQAGFANRVRESGLEGNLSVANGEVARAILSRISMADLLVISLSYPTGNALADRLASGTHSILRRSPRPVLAVTGAVSRLDNLLLAYDGSPKSKEALFLTAYSASRYHLPVTVVTVSAQRIGSMRVMEEALEYLENHGVKVQSVRQKGEVDEVILDVAYNRRCNLILMGGYGNAPVVEMVVGSAVDRLLRRTEIPVLICQ